VTHELNSSPINPEATPEAKPGAPVNAIRIPVLMYHRVGEPDHARDIYCIHPDRFSAQMRALAGAGYRSVSIEDFDAWHRGTKLLPEGAFVLTFDDGFTGVHDFAAPVLKELGWPATVFVVAGKLGGKSDWEITIKEPMHPHPLMDATQLHNLSAQGFSLHSHSLLHHDLTKLDTLALEQDLRDSRTLIADITGKAPAYLAYPYGRHNEVVRNAAQRVGFTTAFAVESGFNRPGENTFQIRRLDVFGTDTPVMLLRKIRLGTNDGSLAYLMHYYLHRILRLN
jgi:peptidoglycan/xylan/chitin deacetylase (PgdA/CDA1 family)